MSNVKRVFVEKKPEFAVEAKELRHEIRHYLGIMNCIRGGLQLFRGVPSGAV